MIADLSNMVLVFFIWFLTNSYEIEYHSETLSRSKINIFHENISVVISMSYHIQRDFPYTYNLYVVGN